MINVDVIIFGGGIAGLWTLACLTNQGYNAILLENSALGAGQTIKSQGIIHGGLKYALTGQLNTAAISLQDIPVIWQQCLQGKGDIDLSAVKILSNGQYMWSANKFTGGISTLFASNALKSHVNITPESEWPSILTKAKIFSKVYKLQESILDVQSLLKTFSEKLISRCIKIDQQDGFTLEIDDNHHIKSVSIKTNDTITKITANKYIFTAGKANKAITHKLYNAPEMQLRPLHMVIVKSANIQPLYGHCIGLGSTPRITITTHIAKDQIPVWYLGGKLAEEGVNRNNEQQIIVAKQELTELFPNIDLSNAKFASFYVDRAEAKQSNSSKPNSTTLFDDNNYITAWPTKLALAPLLAQQILKQIQDSGIAPSNIATSEILQNMPRPIIAEPIWEQLL